MSRLFVLPQDQQLKFYIGFVTHNSTVRLQTTFRQDQNYAELLKNSVSNFEALVKEDPSYAEESQAHSRD